MAKRIYVGNLGYDTSRDDIERLFSQFGTVRGVDIIMERGTERSKGFGFVEMSADQEADAAIATLHGKEVGGRRMTVNEAKPRTEQTERGGGYRGGRSRGW